MSDSREARLPKWAQEELLRLRRKLEVEQKRNAELRGEVGETNTHVQNYISDDQPLPNDARVKFQLGGRYDQHVTVHVEAGRLWLNGGRFLVIHPHVSNAFRVAIGED
ncbi:hypothetical protein ACFTXM_09650 [Streptomyces sp. NPDC056930]|uniref:DUF7239 family protein n=1 Tax=Streptomyces sp. NPDC056930 TaxID=3345967 RepID=UPI003627C43B